MTDASTITPRLIAVIEELAPPGTEVTRDSELKALDIDSLDLAEIAQAMADEFQAEVPTEMLESVQTVGELADALAAGSA